jgi:hypothetical protein
MRLENVPCEFQKWMRLRVVVIGDYFRFVPSQFLAAWFLTPIAVGYGAGAA